VAEDSEGGLLADVWKVGHHGSKNSTTEEFLNALGRELQSSPRGEGNPYGHPAPELLERLETSHARISRTDRGGAVHIITGGKDLEISCPVECVELPVVTISPGTEAPDGRQHQQY